jgi:hypothetical protein
MKIKNTLLVATASLLLFGCPSKKTDDSLTISPDAGSTYKSGDVVAVSAHYPSSLKPDSVVYLMDSTRVGVKKDTTSFSLKTDSIPLGPRILTAKVYTAGQKQEVSTNIVLLAAKAPEEYTFKVEKVFPHDTSCFTEGLLFHDDVFYESGGGYLDPPPGSPVDQQSSLRS